MDAAAVALERDTVVERVCEALSRVEQERAVADPVESNDDKEHIPDKDALAPHDINQTLLLHEAAAIINLHA